MARFLKPYNPLRYNVLLYSEIEYTFFCWVVVLWQRVWKDRPKKREKQGKILPGYKYRANIKGIRKGRKAGKKTPLAPKLYSIYN
jgi:hypothetical protein